MYILSDISLAVARALVASRGGDANVTKRFPGVIPLPVLFYRSSDGQKKLRDGSHLPSGLEIDVGELFMKARLDAASQPAATAADGKRKVGYIDLSQGGFLVGGAGRGGGHQVFS